jgi:hypothetical protein
LPIGAVWCPAKLENIRKMAERTGNDIALDHPAAFLMEPCLVPTIGEMSVLPRPKTQIPIQKGLFQPYKLT